MQINIQGKNIDLTDDVKNYALAKVTNLERVLSKIEEKGGEVTALFEVSKSTNHHKSGDVFHADCLIHIDGDRFYASADEEDIRKAIDTVKDELFREINKKKERNQTLFKRGGASVKKMLKGLSKRNPFTSKY